MCLRSCLWEHEKFSNLCIYSMLLTGLEVVGAFRILLLTSKNVRWDLLRLSQKMFVIHQGIKLATREIIFVVPFGNLRSATDTLTKRRVFSRANDGRLGRPQRCATSVNSARASVAVSVVTTHVMSESSSMSQSYIRINKPAASLGDPVLLWWHSLRHRRCLDSGGKAFSLGLKLHQKGAGWFLQPQSTQYHGMYTVGTK